VSKKSKRILALLNDPGQKKRFLEALNRDTMDAAAPVGNGEMTILKDMNELADEHEQHMQDLKGGSRVE